MTSSQVRSGYVVSSGEAASSSSDSMNGLYYETLGNPRNPAVALIHAGFLDRRMWDEQFRLFASEGLWAIRYDARGHGKSPRPAEAFDDAADLKDLLEKVGVNKKVSLLGLSNGGSIAIDFALEYPGRVKCLVLVAPTVTGYEYADSREEKLDKAMEKEWARWENALKNSSIDEAVEIHLKIMAGSLDEEAKTKVSKIAVENYGIFKNPIDDLKIKADPPAFKRLSEIRVPTLLIWGDNDYPGQISQAERVQSLIPGSRKILIHGADHLVNLSCPDVFNRVVLNYLHAQNPA